MTKVGVKGVVGAAGLNLRPARVPAGNLRPNKAPDKRRDLYLDRDERGPLLNVTAGKPGPWCRRMPLAAWPDALASLVARDFNADTRTLSIGQTSADVLVKSRCRKSSRIS